MLKKLIPKKGDSTKIGEWRPISLLCCGYKIISGVVANRLEKYISKNIGRGQKGFLKHKNIGACGINIIDSISKSWVHKEKMGVLCVDFSKAFDCVEHEFITKVLGFFNYGDIMVGMVKTILRNRQGRILLDQGVSDMFRVERGTPQGDKASPYLFILCIEILLIKMEIEAGDSIGVCRFNEQLREKFGLESMLSEAYADDLTILFKWDMIGLNSILEIIKSFARVSGLEINEKKTQLMITGGEGARVGSTIGEILVVDNVSLLGIKIDRTLEKLSENWDRVLGKIENYSRYWKVFKLSISGRVMVAKTYLLSQATYLMGIIPLPVEKSLEMNRVIIDYVNGGERVLAHDKKFLQKELGGYGIVDSYKMDMYIKANWIRRWMNNKWIKDYSECICIKGEYDEPDCVNSMDTYLFRDCMASKNIMLRWAEYKGEFYKVGRNVYGALAFVSEFVIGNMGPQRISVFNIEREREFEVIMRRIRVKDLLDEQWRIKDKLGMEREIGGLISFAEFFRIRTELYRLQNMVVEGSIFIRNLKTLFRTVTKGSRILRIAVTSKESHVYKNNDILAHRSIIGITDREEVLDRDICEMHMGIWSKTSLKPGFKDFLFRYTHGRLFVNNTRANYDDTDRWCTFCAMKEKVELGREGILLDSQESRDRMRRLPAETIRHLFWECRCIKPHIDLL